MVVAEEEVVVAEDSLRGGTEAGVSEADMQTSSPPLPLAFSLSLSVTHHRRRSGLVDGSAHKIIGSSI